MLVCVWHRVEGWAWVCWNYLMLYLLGAWYLLKELITTHKSPIGLPSQKGRVAIVTGGGRGIGLEAVKRFLQLDMTVVVAGRDVPVLEDAVAKVRSYGVQEGVAVCLDLDLTSMESVRNFVNEFETLKLPLHVLVNNAGIMFWPLDRTIDGHESHWSVNYLGHFLLTHLLMPHLTATSVTTPHSPARVVNLSSSVHYIGTINFDDVDSKKCYNAQAAYAQSKLALMMFTLSLAERYGGSEGVLVANAVHPGVVATELFQHVAWATTFPWLAHSLLKTPKQGSDTVVYCALSSEVKEGGHYYENCTPTTPSSKATRTVDQHRLWDLSCRQLGIQVFGQA